MRLGDVGRLGEVGRLGGVGRLGEVGVYICARHYRQLVYKNVE